MSQSKLELLESQLIIDKKNWTNFYLLLKEIEDKELWKEAKYNSFTQWVKDFCIKTKTHESIVWNRKKAGRVYDSYVKIKEQQNIEVKSINDSNVSVDSLVLLDKINKYDENLASQLVDKVINREITKKDLRELYQRVRPIMISDISKNPHNKPKLEKPIINNKITENEIVTALYSLDWLGGKSKCNRFKSAFESNKSRVFIQFPLITGTRKNIVDMLICENLTSEYSYDINLHGVEIKAFIPPDTKYMYADYTSFVDYLWLAVPSDLIDVAEKNSFNDFGIIAIDNDKTVTVVRPANKLSADLRHETLKNIVLKIM